MATTILLCGAVPFDPPVYYESPIRPIVYCNCAVIHQHRPPPPPPPRQQLPDVIPRLDPSLTTPKQVPAVKQQSTDEEDFSQLRKDNNILAWRQVGRDLRMIADSFSNSGRNHQRRRPTSADWIWRALIQSAVVYVVYKVHRWTSSPS